MELFNWTKKSGNCYRFCYCYSRQIPLPLFDWSVRLVRGFKLLPRSRWELRFLGYYAASSGNSVLTFRDNLSVPSSRVKLSKSWSLKMGPIACTEMSERNYHSMLRKIPKERRSH